MVMGVVGAAIVPYLFLTPFLPSLSANRPTALYPYFEKGEGYVAKAIAFSPDGSTLYIATNDQKVHATSSYGYRSPYWSESVGVADLCDMTVSQDGLSVGVTPCGTLKSAIRSILDKLCTTLWL